MKTADFGLQTFQKKQLQLKQFKPFELFKLFELFLLLLLFLNILLLFTNIASAQDINVPEQVVLPEVAKKVSVSSSDVNRIVCSSGNIKDVVSSTEKGLNVKIHGSNAFLKLLITKKGEEEVYRTDPIEIFVVCGNSVYNLIAMPERIPSQTIRLSSGKTDVIKKNIAIFDGMPLEKKLMFLIKSAYTEEIPESFTIIQSSKKIDIFKDILLTLRRIVVVEGEGLQLKEYLVELKGDTTRELHERDFLKTDITTNPLAISLDRLILRKGNTIRLFIVERMPHETKN